MNIPFAYLNNLTIKERKKNDNKIISKNMLLKTSDNELYYREKLNIT